ncbi:MAG: MBL fold metallo-hydrolase [Candidatus Bathyarchaeota archaeon]|nr:MBL fold metallo-hydrolase [Candidatus Bathyarchaeota archaeon]
MKQTARILPKVYLVGSSEISNSGDCMVYLVDCKSELALIDAGVSSDINKISNNIKRLGLKPQNISTLFATHCHIDHVGGAASFRENYGCKTIAHELDGNAIEQADRGLTGAFVYHQDLIPCKIDVRLSGSDGKIRVGDKTFRWLHTPGHTPGSISILLNTSSGNILFAQDVHGPFMPEFNSKISDWVKSVKKLVKLDFDILAEGHLGIYRPKDRAVEYINSCLTRYGYR